MYTRVFVRAIAEGFPGCRVCSYKLCNKNCRGFAGLYFRSDDFPGTGAPKDGWAGSADQLVGCENVPLDFRGTNKAIRPTRQVARIPLMSTSCSKPGANRAESAPAKTYSSTSLEQAPSVHFPGHLGTATLEETFPTLCKQA